MVRQAVMVDMKGNSNLDMLTHGMPAALLPVLDEPLCGYGLHLLRRHGIGHVWMKTTDACMADMLGDGSLHRLELRYGAGWPAVGDNESVLLIRGDILTDINLSYAMDKHMQSGALATEIVSENILDGRTGILLVRGYLLKSISPEETTDDMIRRLHDFGIDIQVVPMPGYWREIKDMDSYHQAQLDLLRGRVGLPVSGKRQGHAIIARGMWLPSGIDVRGRCYVGAGTRIRTGTVLGADTVLGRNVEIKGKAYLENVCLCPNTCLEGDAVLRNIMVIPRIGNTSLQQMVEIKTGNT